MIALAMLDKSSKSSINHFPKKKIVIPFPLLMNVPNKGYIFMQEIGLINFALTENLLL